MVLLSVDPGLTNTGWALFYTKSESLTLKSCDVISPPRKYTIPEKLFMIHTHLQELIVEYSVTDIALETPFLGKNAQSFLKLGYIRGLLYLLAEIYGLIIHEYAPQVIKKAVFGHGRADKEQISATLRRIFPGLEQPKKYDITDAIAVGLCAYRLKK